MQLSNIQLLKEGINNVVESQKHYTESKNPDEKNKRIRIILSHGYQILKEVKL